LRLQSSSDDAVAHQFNVRTFQLPILVMLLALKICLFEIWAVRNYLKAHIRTPHKTCTFNIQKIVIIWQQKTFLHFL